MVASLRVSLRKALLLVICFSLITFLLFTTSTVKVLWFPLGEQLGNKRTVLEHNEVPETYESNGNSAVAEWLLTLTSKPHSKENLPKDWYFKGGSRKPKEYANDGVHLLPEQADFGDDRIQKQLMFVPKGYDEFTTPVKNIILWNGLNAWNVHSGNAVFEQCPVSRCSLDTSKSRAMDADAILFKDSYSSSGFSRPKNQVWILYLLECPYHTSNFARLQGVINWTATYRMDSDIVAPYEKWIYYDDNVKEKSQHKDYAANKTKKVAWFVSNCGAKNHRLAYATELSKYIQVDIYGACGSFTCPRSSSQKCFEILNRDYKFYLAFENSNCQDYITEKFFVNGLQHDVIPVVMGARPSEYEKAAPHRSYIHTDNFESPEELAQYLNQLDNDDEQYNSYFRWKGTGEFVNTFFWCRLCAMLHAPLPHKVYDDVNEWWRGKNVCTRSSWRKAKEN
ncbi:glycoprotein 3-alpha-L-fucosyltransferase A [Agrilus planipennis]|uniref:Fucosyltransferase n=1 Tax=Agrilus planipennis TaxID=224129 RepID=A0A1W4XKA8_AGRPL|nr:glycoprotein 3-alpha-L-fucosyltransferase A [Agrilus planipennis]